MAAAAPLAGFGLHTVMTAAQQRATSCRRAWRVVSWLPLNMPVSQARPAKKRYPIKRTSQHQACPHALHRRQVGCTEHLGSPPDHVSCTAHAAGSGRGAESVRALPGQVGSNLSGWQGVVEAARVRALVCRAQ